MCMSPDFFAAVCFGLVPLFANILLLFVTKYRVHLSFGFQNLKKVVGKSLLFVILVIAGIMVAQSWFSTLDKATLCIDRSLLVVGAFFLAAVMAFASVGFEQIKTASGVNLSDRYFWLLLLLVLPLCVVFYVVRMSVHGWLR